MPRYELDDYAREHPTADAGNASCAASWRACAGAASPRGDLHHARDFTNK
jgi:hypothetical protein